MASNPSSLNRSARLRINLNSKVNSTGRLIEGEASHFGIDEENGIEFMQAARRLENVRLHEVHLHAQSNMLSLLHAVANYKFGLSAEAGAFVTRVLYRKTSRGISYAITDGGFTLCQIATGSGQLVRQNLPLRVISDRPRT